MKALLLFLGLLLFPQVGWAACSTVLADCPSPRYNDVTAATGTFSTFTQGGKTITLGGNLTTSGANNVTFVTSGPTTITLPTSGTMISNTVSTLSSLTSIGTIATGTWQATVLVGQYGGTGVANTGKTITLGGNLTTSGANDVTFTTSGSTNITLPTSGTMISNTVTTLSSLTSIGTIATGVWQGTIVVGQYGGTGVNKDRKSVV